MSSYSGATGSGQAAGGHRGADPGAAHGNNGTNPNQGGTEQTYGATPQQAPWIPDATAVEPAMPTAAPAEQPPGIVQDPTQLPQGRFEGHAEVGGVKRERPADDGDDPQDRRRDRTATVRPPASPGNGVPTRQPDAYSIHSPDGLTHECPEPSDQGSEDSDRSKLGDELIDPNVKEDTMKKLTDVMAGINKSIELLMKRVDQIDDKGGAKGGATDALQAINSKDVDKPTKYDGTQWVAWSADFVAFLERRDRRWGKLLKEIEKHSIDPLTTDKKRLIALELDIAKGTLKEDFTNQLYEYLKNFTTAGRP